MPPSLRVPPANDADDMKGRSAFPFLGLAEFGPRSLIYHEGSQYRVRKLLLGFLQLRFGGAQRHLKLNWCQSLFNSQWY